MVSIKGTFKLSIETVIIIILAGLAFVTIVGILNYFGVNLMTPICRAFCIPIMSIIPGILKTLIIGYAVSPVSFCSWCG